MKNRKTKIVALLRRANAEAKEYANNNKFESMSQACEKVWVAFTLLVELKIGKNLQGHDDIMANARKLDLNYIASESKWLHKIHYEGSMGTTKDEILYTIKNTIKLINKELKK